MAGGAADDHRDIELRLAILEAQMKEVHQWRDRAIGAWTLAKLAAVLSAGAWGLILWAKEHIRP